MHEKPIPHHYGCQLLLLVCLQCHLLLVLLQQHLLLVLLSCSRLVPHSHPLLQPPQQLSLLSDP
jgi:hypothetical protein